MGNDAKNNWISPEERALRHRKQWEGPSGPRKAVKYALFDTMHDVQVSKAHWHKECVVIEAFELGLVHMSRGDRWLSKGYEIREV